MSPINAAPVSSPAAKTEDRSRFRLRLGLALTALMLVAVLSTALIVHVSWMWTADRNVGTVVSSLNAQTAQAVRQELETTFRASEGAVEIVRSILFQGAISTEDEAKREFVFLSVLRSLPSVSWIGFGFPDGRFFGAHALDNGKIEMVEINDPLPEGGRSLRRDRYQPIPGDIFFEERTKGKTAYVPLGSKWYRAAMDDLMPVWSMVDILPSGFEPAAVVSTQLKLHGRFQGVIMVSLNLKRLSSFLGGLDIAHNGAAVIVSNNGTVIASSLPTMKSAALSDTQGNPMRSALRASFDGNLSEQGTVEASNGEIFYATSTPLDFNGWKLLTAIPRSTFTAEIDRNTRWLLAAVAALALLAAAAAAIFANLSFARPIQKIAGELRHIESFSLGELRHIPSYLTELDDLSAALRRMAGSLKAFGLYVPSDIVRTLIQQGVDPKPGGELRQITVIFADLPGFTQLTEAYGTEVAPFLTEFLTLATKAIHQEGGTVDKFIGDCIMGLWNAPAHVPDHALRACRAADAIRSAMRNLPRPDGRIEGQKVRIGINTGTALVGNIGSIERLSYTAIGDVVNVASRLEALGKELNSEITVSKATRDAAGPKAQFRPLGESAVKGRAAEVAVYELVGIGEAMERGSCRSTHEATLANTPA
jgi:class 3 adenylate cyclase/HAMP domain-containing protein